MIALCCVLSVTACYDDKGNYNYKDVPVITAENLPETTISVVQKTDPIILRPSFTSSIDGVIDDNPNYEFGCLLYKNAGVFPDGSRYKDINPEHNKDIDYIPDDNEGDYTCWYTVTDKRTGEVTNFEIPVKITSATYEGWMVLCDEGAENKVHMDLISILSKERPAEIYHDVLGENAPDITNAKSVFYDPWPKYAHGDYLWLVSEDGTYSLNASTLQCNSAYNIMETDFLVTPADEQVIAMDGLYGSYNFIVTNKGNLYFKYMNRAGSIYETPVNTFVADTDPQFAVAPFIGVSQRRPLDSRIALFYDKDNKRFVKWDAYTSEGGACIELADPESPRFSYTTGKDMIAMVNTRFSEATTYSILEDDSHNRYVYGISLAGGDLSQTYYQQINAEGFNNATEFAFHSQYPYMFYNGAENKVYCYHLMNNTVTQPLTLDGEEITLLKFNLFQNTEANLSDSSEEFMNQQYYLIVGSYKKNATDDNGGILRFYKFDSSSQALALVSEYTGFGKIRDAVYRER